MLLLYNICQQKQKHRKNICIEKKATILGCTSREFMIPWFSYAFDQKMPFFFDVLNCTKEDTEYRQIMLALQSFYKENVLVNYLVFNQSFQSFFQAKISNIGRFQLLKYKDCCISLSFITCHVRLFFFGRWLDKKAI